ncbi:30S ribosomal protein S11 [Mycoplasma sp. E35C]|uniref:30S ribosomal protein S11 n=1 Tax=Mycoplasma sp. E35C TaxID=2801918 RepID=UPI001CA4429E|nr:30S ribosomal protein S11 [Mycoplasma sp. E35C]QZX49064.1 30S ribosomal protein S11 [Mycoplasma sp. E35C]
MAKKKKTVASNGIAHIHATSNNSIITITDINGNALTWSSSGAIGYKGAKKKTPYSAGVAAEKAAKEAMAMGLATVKVYVNGVGRGKETAIRSLAACGLTITEIHDVTPIPHNGCRPPKKPR